MSQSMAQGRIRAAPSSHRHFGPSDIGFELSASGERLIDYAPHGQWKMMAFVGALRQRVMTASFVLEGLAYVKTISCSDPKRDEIVMMDNLSVHKVCGVTAAIEAAGATLIYLPPYSPDLNPIEMAFSKLNAHMRKGLGRWSRPTFSIPSTLSSSSLLAQPRKNPRLSSHNHRSNTEGKRDCDSTVLTTGCKTRNQLRHRSQ